MKRWEWIFADDRLAREVLAVAAFPDVDYYLRAGADRVDEPSGRSLPADRLRVHRA